MSITVLTEVSTMTRKSQQVETRMVAEYLAKEYPKFSFITKVPLGKVDEALMAKEGYQRALGLTRPFRPEADAVVILPNYLVLVEAKVWNVVNGLAKLPLYKSLVPFTPELQQYLPREILMEIVVGWTNSNLEIMAREHGIAVKVYSPEWLKEVVESQHKYWTKEYQDRRQQRLQLREFYGIE
jgi:hypothetical protein